MSSSYILETCDLTKEFKGFVAVNKVNLRVQRGHIHALIGPNGAGKTTCFKPAHQVPATHFGQHRLRRCRHHARGARRQRPPRRHPLVPDLRRVSST